MSLAIKLNTKQIKTWNIGQPLPCNYDEIAQIEYIQADGDELEYIKNTFVFNNNYTIPIPRNRVVRWFGDIAKIIVDSL